MSGVHVHAFRLFSSGPRSMSARAALPGVRMDLRLLSRTWRAVTWPAQWGEPSRSTGQLPTSWCHPSCLAWRGRQTPPRPRSRRCGDTRTSSTSRHCRASEPRQPARL